MERKLFLAKQEALKQAVVKPFMMQLEDIGSEGGEVLFDRKLHHQEIQFLMSHLRKHHVGIRHRIGYIIRARDDKRAFTTIEVKEKGGR
ncbi:MAG TPA: hypothetical protein VLF68_04080 [Candidatus Saccharimonadales bacterium]|nr:hypothetical protein [Candidatus Saccharimonadales bacterium]